MKTIIFPSILTLLLSSSCVHYVYMPNVMNVPLLKEQFDSHISASLGTGESTTSGDVQTSFAVTKHMGIMSNYAYTQQGNESSGAKGNYLDLAAGYFVPIGEKGVFEVFGGAGFNNQHHVFSTSSSTNATASGSLTWDLAYLKEFIQPSIGITGNGFDAAFSTRLCHMAFTRTETSPTQQPTLVKLNEDIFMIEPAVTIRFGWKYAKFQLQVVTCFDNTKYAQSFRAFERWNANVGIFFSLSNRFWKNQG